MADNFNSSTLSPTTVGEGLSAGATAAIAIISTVVGIIAAATPIIITIVAVVRWTRKHAPKITNKPENPNIRLSSGASQTITVRYDQGYPRAKVKWSKNGHLINIPDPRIATANGETKLTLTNNDPGVRGTYGVKVSNGVGNDTAMYFVEPEFPPTITNKPDNPNIRLPCGTSQTITVRYDQGYPLAKVEWSKDGHSINISDPYIATANGETKLTLTNSDPSVRGTYEMKVSNGVGNDDTAVYFVEVEYAPKITNKPVNPNIRLSSGASQTITVRYDQGYPQAKVEWSKDGHLINIPDPRITTANAETKLTLTNNDPGVRGTYGVKVSNGVENDDTAVYFVEPEYAPNITNKPDNPNIRLTSGASQTITVRYDQGFPHAKVEWSKDEHLINIPDPRITTANGETKLTLTNNDPGVRGTYGVKVSNDVGNDTAVYFVEPECSPKVTDKLPNNLNIGFISEAKQTNTARYDEDFPQAKVEWSKDEQPITDARIATDSDETRLTLANNGHGVWGKYKVENSNHVEINAVQEAECSEHSLFKPEPSSPPPAKPPVTPVLQYASYLASLYTREKSLTYEKWPQVKSKKYINPTHIQKEDITQQEIDRFRGATIHGNIDHIKQSKQVVDIGQIAQLLKGSACILVEGAQGIGKSTFAWKLCRKWGKKKLLQQYQLVVLLRLRDKSVRTAKEISDLFRYDNHQIQQALVEEVKRTGGKQMLLLFEGYDELPVKLRTKKSIFLDVIKGEKLPEATVLVTSRPWGSEFLLRECKRHISQRIEILGFTDSNIQSYLKSNIPDDRSLLADLKKFIACNPHINSLMYVPLNSAIVVEVYRNSRKDHTLVAKTTTELYSSLVRSLLLRHLFNHSVYGKKKDWNIQSFTDLPKDVYEQLCKQGELAYKGICDDQQFIFYPKDFETLGMSMETIETLGLIQRVQELHADKGCVVSYNFLHLTVQQYLAAFHLSQQPVEKQIKHLEEVRRQTVEYQYWHFDKQHHFHMVVQFLCGIRKFSGYPSEVLSTLCIEKSGDDSTSDDSVSVVREVAFITLHWLFETQDKDLIDKVLGSSDIQLDDKFRRVTPYDCFVLGYCVSYSNCTWSIDLRCRIIGDEGVELLVRGAVEGMTYCTGEISEMHLRKSGITSKGVEHLLDFPNQLINKLETLNLNDNELDSESLVVLARLIPHIPHLKKLYLSKNRNIGQGGAVRLITSLTKYKSLKTLMLNGTGIGVEDCKALSELLPSLKKLNINSNDLPPEAVKLIIGGLHPNTALTELSMSDSHFLRQNTISLALVLKTNHTLTDLDLGTCNIDSDGACDLAHALCTNDTLQKLQLCNNPIGVKGARAFTEMQLKSKSLKELSLQDD